MRVFSPAYLVTLAVTAVSCVGLSVGARRHPGPWVAWVNRVLAALLLGVSVWWIWTTGVANGWDPANSLPLALCDVATLVASAALLARQRLLVELTWFWGLAGSLQSLLTPDVGAPLGSATFFEYVLAHAGIVTSAVFLVVGQRLVPRRRAAPRVLAITIAYTAFVGLIDALTGADYMYLRSPPSSWTLLTVLGPWPWYILSATGVAVVLVTALDAPFWKGRRTATNPAVAKPSPATPPAGAATGIEDAAAGTAPAGASAGRDQEAGAGLGGTSAGRDQEAGAGHAGPGLPGPARSRVPAR